MPGHNMLGLDSRFAPLSAAKPCLATTCLDWSAASNPACCIPLSSPFPPRSQTMPGHNMLGLEIRQPIIERANKWAASLGLHRAVLFLM